jgi:hypothetical protein
MADVLEYEGAGNRGPNLPVWSSTLSACMSRHLHVKGEDGPDPITRRMGQAGDAGDRYCSTL